MLIENFIANYARKKNENYLQFKPSETIIIPRNKGNVPTLLYIHVPFCEELCPYCSFNRVRFQEDLARAYFDALRKEIVMYKDLGYDFKALYAGGGTPTILIDELEKTVLLIREMFNITEISVETNPNHLTQDNINKLREMGVNRLSVGVQTFDDGLLKTIERYHKYGSGEDIKERLSYTQGNFQTLNVDMIFNFPTQSMEILEKDLSTIIELMVDQVTYYPLMVSSFTKDIMNKKLGTVDYDRGNEFYRKITEMLSPQYKASTAWCFSRKDKIFKSGATQALISSEVFSSHSEREGEAQSALQTEGATQAPVIDEYVVNYEEYAGLGSGSIGYLGGSAYANTFDIKEYIDKINRGSLPIAAIKNFSMKERLCYDLLMKLFGLSLDTQQLTQKHGVNAYRYLWSEILFFRLTGGIEKKDSMLMLTKKGQYYWVLMMREFFIGVNNFRDFCRAQNKT
ncbi:MAG: radical SAM protein [Pseudomonadota bacterium]|nr:radical SAM protein [Pseudomonadota bacterium]